MLKADYTTYTLEFKKPAGTSRGVLTTKRGWYISIWEEYLPETRGIGEIAILPGLSPDGGPNLENKIIEVSENIHTLAFDFQRTMRQWPAIRFALETALLDLQTGGKQVLFPSAFTRGEEAIPINGLIWMADPKEMSRQIEDKLKEGFHCIKMKIGAIDFKEEFRLLEHLRNRFSVKEVELRVDANGAFTPEEAPKILDRLAQLDIHSIEQPIKAGQWDAMAKICADSPLPIALDEELIGINETARREKLLSLIKPHYIVLKPSLTGGFFSSQQWIDLAEKNGANWWVTSALESNLGLNAIAQWSYTLKNPMAQGLGTGGLFVNNVKTPLKVKEGALWYKA